MATNGDIAKALHATLITPNEPDRNLEPANMVDGLFAISRAIEKLSRAVDRLGTNDAATQMGAIELLAKETRDGLTAIAAAIERHD